MNMNGQNTNEQYDDEMLEMWLEKLNRPGRLLQRNNEIITKEKLLEMMDQCDIEIDAEEDAEEDDQYDDEIIEMWLEKLNRPGRVLQRNNEIITKEKLLEMIVQSEIDVEEDS